MERILLSLSCLFLLVACRKEPVRISPEEDAPIGNQVIPQVLPGQGPVDAPGHGKELWFAIGAMTGVPGVNANGVTQGHYLEDGTSIVTIQLNVEQAPDGSFYEAWLVPASGQLKSIGHLRTPFGDVRHSLKFIEETDIRGFVAVRVTQEQDDGNSAASPPVAEGLLKERVR